MSVKRSKSGSRVLAVFEQIARRQPVGVSELSRQLDADKSAVQRAIMTLADEGWIHAAPGSPTRWQLTGHIHLVAHLAHASSSLHHRARPALEALRDESGETVGLTAPDIGRFVVIDVIESRQILRTAPHVGMVVETHDSATGRAVLPYLSPERQVELLGRAPDSATGRAVLPYLSPERQVELLGRAPDARLLKDFAATLRQGYFVSEDDLVGGSINVAAPIFEVDARPVGAVILSAPRERLAPDSYDRVGGMVLRTARQLSRATPDPPRLPRPDAELTTNNGR